jgi:outer membrane immunogenic protein
MRKILLSGVAFVALAVGPALAADMPRKAYGPPPPPPPPVLSWTGWYIGLNAGGIWSNNSDFNNTVVSTFCNPALGGCAPNLATNALTAALPLSFDLGNKAGFIGGGQFGYNYQTGALVWGFETDIQGTSLSRSGIATNVVPFGGGNPSVATLSAAANQKLDVFGTLRGRLGWTPSPPWLLYATGGLAYGRVDTDVAFNSSFTACFCGPNASTFAESDKWRAGWTAGGGVEWMFAPRWSAKAEYLYYDLGHQTLNNFLSQVNGAGTRFVEVGIASEVHNRGSIARVGVNYHF